MTVLYKKPKLTYFFIAVCVLVFFYEIFYGLQHGSFGSENFNSALTELFDKYGFSIQNLLDKRIWVFITSVFLHADPEHLILNMIALLMFGRVIEMSLGRKKFLIIFFVSAVIANLTFMVFSLIIGSFGTVVIGASAAIFGLMGTAMLVKPFEFVFYPYLIPVPLILVALLYTLYNIASLILVAVSLQESNISYISHIGGLVAGMIFGFREEGNKKGFAILLFIILLLIALPFLWGIFNFLETFNYVSILSKFFS
jgi:membrane associated rhomboid family serine protease